MKIAVTITRILAALLYLFSAAVVLFKLMPQPEATGNVKIFMDGVTATGYLMTLIKITEAICAIALLSGYFVPLATIVIFPINVNILLFHLFLAPEGLPIAIFLLLSNLLWAYYYRDKYKMLFYKK